MSIKRLNYFKQEKEDNLMFLADGAFRQWRFALHHRSSYDMIRMDSNEFAVVSKYYDRERNIRYGDIVDFEPFAFNEDCLAKIFNCACVSLKNEVDMLTIQAVPNSLLHRAGKKMGFVETNMKHNFCMKVKKTSNDYLYDSSSWIIKWGDYLR